MSYMVAPVHPIDPPVFLKPRPLALYPGSFALLPLLPKRPALKPLPSELWSKVFTFVFMGEQVRKVDATERRRVTRSNWTILFVCKRWMVRPLSSLVIADGFLGTLKSVLYMPSGVRIRTMLLGIRTFWRRTPFSFGNNLAGYHHVFDLFSGWFMVYVSYFTLQCTLAFGAAMGCMLSRAR